MRSTIVLVLLTLYFKVLYHCFLAWILHYLSWNTIIPSCLAWVALLHECQKYENPMRGSLACHIPISLVAPYFCSWLAALDRKLWWEDCQDQWLESIQSCLIWVYWWVASMHWRSDSWIWWQISEWLHILWSCDTSLCINSSQPLPSIV